MFWRILSGFTVFTVVLLLGAPVDGAVVIFHLGSPQVQSEAAGDVVSYDLTLDFEGDGFMIEAFQLSVLGSTPSPLVVFDDLTMQDVTLQYSRFSFELDADLIDRTWVDLSVFAPGVISSLKRDGVATFGPDPFGPLFPNESDFIQPGIGIPLGRLVVDLRDSEISAAELHVTISDGPDDFDTDAIGSAGGQFVPSFNDFGNLQAVPEPGSLLLWTASGIGTVLALRRRRLAGDASKV